MIINNFKIGSGIECIQMVSHECLNVHIQPNRTDNLPQLSKLN